MPSGRVLNVRRETSGENNQTQDYVFDMLFKAIQKARWGRSQRRKNEVREFEYSSQGGIIWSSGDQTKV